MQSPSVPPASIPTEAVPKAAADEDLERPTRIESVRFKAFIGIQLLFLGASPLAGGFQYKWWSMMDTSLLVLSIGMSTLAFVLETPAGRRAVFRAAAMLYVVGVLDMAANILLSGVYGWKGVTA
ncbi:MAG: hypothetical protein ACYSU1_05085 [Planctomycetota bacterium]|jgi:hypothetical protein